MERSKDKRRAMLKAMAAYVLDHGLATASLRPLAKAADTSDRMLIYHFGTKEKLIAALLAHLANDMLLRLNTALPLQPMPSHRALLDEVLALVRAPVFGAYIRFWREVTAMAGQGGAVHRETARLVIDGFTNWLAVRMPEDEPDPEKAAMAMLTLVEGIHVMDAAGQSAVADVAIETIYRR